MKRLLAVRVCHDAQAYNCAFTRSRVRDHPLLCCGHCGAELVPRLGDLCSCGAYVDLLVFQDAEGWQTHEETSRPRLARGTQLLQWFDSALQEYRESEATAAEIAWLETGRALVLIEANR